MAVRSDRFCAIIAITRGGIGGYPAANTRSTCYVERVSRQVARRTRLSLATLALSLSRAFSAVRATKIPEIISYVDLWSLEPRTRRGTWVTRSKLSTSRGSVVNQAAPDDSVVVETRTRTRLNQLASFAEMPRNARGT